MTASEQAYQILDALGAKLGKRDLVFDANDVASFVLNRRFVVEICFDADREMLAIGMLIGVLPSGAKGAAFAERLLAANYQWRMTGWSTIGLDDANRAVTISRCVPLAATSNEAVAEIVEMMAAAATYWQDELRDLGALPDDRLRGRDFTMRV